MPKINVPNELEVLWCILWPSKSSSVILGGVYLPPDAPVSTRRLFVEYVIETVDFLRSSRPRSRTVLLGDFNNTLSTGTIQRALGVRNIVKEPTRGSAVLDKILTDIESHEVPTISAALGTSDHRTVIWKTTGEKQRWNNLRSVRPLRDSNIRRFGSWICDQNWQDVLTSENLDDAAELLENKLWRAYEAFFPQVTYQCKTNEPPWMSQHVKLLIRQRDRAHSRHQIGRLKILRKKYAKR